jgi:hydroxymethylbilane synthase
MPDTLQHLRLGTRGSMLARTQSGWVARELEARNPGLRVELVIVQTSGDRITDRPLHAFGGKGLFTKELEQALLAGSVDFAVHSYKDVPVTMPLVETAELIIAAVPAREDARDAWVSTRFRSLADLPPGAKVGTGSLRRRCQLLARRPDLLIEPIRGNIDTRLRKLRDGEYEAIILAMAGLKRASLFDPQIMSALEPEVMLPAAGQGALALECQRDNMDVRRVLESMHDAFTASCVNAERAIVQGLNGDCHSPIAAFAALRGKEMHLSVAVGARDGHPPLLRAISASEADAAGDLIQKVLRNLENQGVGAHLGENGRVA